MEAAQPNELNGGAPALVEENSRLREALQEARAVQRKLHGLVEELSAQPWHPALFQSLVATPQGTRALVWSGQAQRIVSLHPEVDAAALRFGDTVYLDASAGNLMHRAGDDFSAPTETAAFIRFGESGELLVRSRDDELVLRAADRFDASELRPGRLVHFDRAARIAFASMEGSAGRQFLLEDAAGFARGSLGGDRSHLDELVDVLGAALLEPELAQRYGLDGRRAVLLYGPPGCGKTLHARTAAAEIARRSGRGCRFAVVRPGEFESPYVGETEANIRACFATLREATDGEPAVLFLDEIESIGRTRGGLGSRHADRSLAALLAEIDGFADCGRVAIVAATNRRDLLDPALHSRLGDVEIPVGRPTRALACDILGIHVGESLPFAAEGGRRAAAAGSPEAGALRADLIETIASGLYAPNADTELCQIQLRDGTRRSVHARELVSGRQLAQLATATRQRAFRRHCAGEGEGLRSSDAAEAVEELLARLATVLSPQNARAHLDDLPDDVDVVRVEAVARRPRHVRRLLRAG